MSQRLVDLNPDLRRLRDVGYSVDVWEREGYLVVRDVPYVTSEMKVSQGVLISELTLNGDITGRPSTHVIHFAGDFPCYHTGRPLEPLRHQSSSQPIGRGLVSNHSFSNKPKPEGFDNYFDKIHHYASVLSHQARAIEPSASPMSFSPILPEGDDTVFNYIDTASSRAGISAINAKLMLSSVAIIGLGGTGSYILDLIAKTPVKEIHLFDGDKFLQHNAFRTPGAPSLTDLQRNLYKVDYLKEIYARMHRGIVAHPRFMGRPDLNALEGMAFTFICMDAGPAKKSIIEHLVEHSKSFIDVGLGVEIAEDMLTGVTRVTTSTPSAQDHIKTTVSFADVNADDAYRRNIQIADLNALNAALAVIRWKKLMGFYFDPRPTFNTIFSISGGELISDAAGRG